MPNRSLYLAAYDIRHPKRLRKALIVLKDFASGGQKSVFECYLSNQEKDELLSRISDVMDLSDDRFLIVPLNQHAVRVLGIAVMPMDPDFFFIG
ncbi:CRISPR-associated endonuclease Cas2 [Nitrincola tibetensis]|uniref:CRISPR-associated endoribonuclease Cas2 n=1 Tax=Nitrincola tibetensis TaxID=2219697 RepID=A0A364NKQ4_9GAMM|nr:CRISPR-associated endonuclease Cas2 [Nitrincola tibetensis]RAU17621.1 CRISPR-associated endonuclease Cas2 [Nitrincola tibetensis]